MPFRFGTDRYACLCFFVVLILDELRRRQLGASRDANTGQQGENAFEGLRPI